MKAILAMHALDLLQEIMQLFYAFHIISQKKINRN